MASKGKGKSLKPKAKAPDDSSTEEPEQSIESLQEQFERELFWCIDQLELGLETQNPDSKRGQEAVKILKILTSAKAPIIKKRQAMRNTFGDYRKKMEEEEKKSTAIAKKIKLSSMHESEMQKSKYIKKSSSKTQHKQSTGETSHKQPTGESSKCETDMNDSFKFNFSINDGNQKATKNESLVTDKMKDQNESAKTEDCSKSVPFTFVKSSTEFKFGFTVSEET